MFSINDGELINDEEIIVRRIVEVEDSCEVPSSFPFCRGNLYFETVNCHLMKQVIVDKHVGRIER